MIKKFLIALATLLAVTTGAFIGASPAQADLWDPAGHHALPVKPSGSARSAFTTCSPNCHYYTAAQATPSAAKDGMYVAMDIYQPTMNTANGDLMTLSEITVENPGVGNTIELGWIVNTTGGAPKLFASAWVNGVFQGYNAGVSTCGQPQTLAPGSTIPGPYPVSPIKKFGIQHYGTWPTGNWWLAYDTGWAGCIPDSWLSGKGATNFSSGTKFQAFTETASSRDLSAGNPPCAQMGSGVKPLTTTSTGVERIANGSYADGTFVNFATLYTSAPNGANLTPYYNIQYMAPAGGGAISYRSVILGGDNTAC